MVRTNGGFRQAIRMLPSELGCPLITKQCCRDSGFRDVANLRHRASTHATILRTNSGSSCRWLRMIPSLGTKLRFSTREHDLVRLHSLDDRRDEADLTHGSFYAYFKSRDALVVEALALAMDRTVARITPRRSLEKWWTTGARKPPGRKSCSATLPPARSNIPDCRRAAASRYSSRSDHSGAVPKRRSVGGDLPIQGRSGHCQRRKMTLALTPPKPNPFEIACSIVMRLASWDTRSTPSAAASPFSRLRVGGATWSRNARIVKIASAPPAAPSR